MKSSPMETNVRRFTVSLPAYLYELGEEEREALHMNRSEFVSTLYRQYLEGVARSRREERYRSAYAAHPLAPEEEALSDLSSVLLVSSTE